MRTSSNTKIAPMPLQIPILYGRFEIITKKINNTPTVPTTISDNETPVKKKRKKKTLVEFFVKDEKKKDEGAAQA